MIFQWSEMYFTPLAIGLIIAYIIFFVVAILLTVWVYKDAKKRDANAGNWLFVVLCFGCIGIIIYLIVREKDD
jgi:uncharacterized membrane protein YozB (DUF420 family)